MAITVTAVDFTKPATTDKYLTEFVPNIKNNISAVAQWLDSTTTSGTSTPQYAKRYDRTSAYIQEYSGSTTNTWDNIVLNITGNAATATTATNAAGNTFYTAIAAAGAEAQIGARVTGYSDVYLFNNASGWGITSNQGGVAFSYSRTNTTFTFNGTFTGITTTQANTDNSTKLASTAFVRSLIPTGIIVMWSGAANAIPSGWTLCDGSLSTPDLRNRFIIGAGTTYSVSDTGGSTDAVVVSHTHTASVTDPGHSHQSYTIADYSAGGYGASFLVASGFTWPDGRASSLTSNNGIQPVFTGVSVSNSTTGVAAANANLPPYYALCFIMKT